MGLASAQGASLFHASSEPPGSGTTPDQGGDVPANGTRADPAGKRQREAVLQVNELAQSGRWPTGLQGPPMDRHPASQEVVVVVDC